MIALRRFSKEMNNVPASSKTERLREIWQKTAKVRMGVGIALMAWSAVAASSWAFAVAWWIAAIRAGLAGTGAFLAVDGLLRSVGIEKNAATVALAVGISVGAVLAIPAAESAEALISGVSAEIPYAPATVPYSVPALPSAIPNPLTPEAVREIFSDIRSDHPRQGCVTLEQSVRRIEWLAKGVPLSESARLPSEVANVGKLLSDPSWKIAKAMEKLWFVGPDSFTNPFETRSAIDAAAKKLNPSQLEKILLEAYGNEPPVLTHSAVEVPPGAVPIPTPETTPIHTESAVVPQSEDGQHSIGKWAAFLALPLGFAGYFGYRKFGKPRKTSPAAEVTDVFSIRAEPPSSEAFSDVTGSVTPAYPALSLAGSEVLMEEYGFDPVVSEDAPPYFALPTPAGELRAAIVSGADGSELRFSWAESWKIRHSVSKSVSAYGEPNELRDAFRQALESAYYETAVIREAAKCEEFRNVRSFEFSRRDAAEMYRQLEEPDIVANNRETGGFWFWSGYSVKDGIFRFGNLANPASSQIDSTSVEFAIRGEHWERYVSTNLSKAFKSDFSPGERKLFMKAAKRAERENPDFPPFPLALDFFNWHKHPWAPLWPSAGDINHPDSASGKFEDSPTLPAVTFAIANEASPRVRLAGEGMSNAHFLKGADFWWGRDYLVTFWKLLRISNEERARRESFVAKAWKAQAVSLGICDRSGRLLHLDHDVRTDDGVFEADLRPVTVRTSGDR